MEIKTLKQKNQELARERENNARTQGKNTSNHERALAQRKQKQQHDLQVSAGKEERASANTKPCELELYFGIDIGQYRVDREECVTRLNLSIPPSQSVEEPFVQTGMKSTLCCFWRCVPNRFHWRHSPPRITWRNKGGPTQNPPESSGRPYR